ncbi:MAG: MFS transporter [Halobacteriota archaeon]
MATEMVDMSFAAAPKKPVHTGLTMGILAVAMYLVILSAGIVSPLLPTLQAEFATTETWTAWALTIYVVVGILTSPIIGKLGDLYGKKKLWILGMGIFAISLVLSGFAWNLTSFVLFRALSGLGLAAIPLSYALIRDEFPAHRISPSLGILTAALGLGAASGVILASVMAQAFGWRWAFYAVGPVAVVLVLLAVIALEESPVKKPGKLDLLGVTTLSAALLSFLVAMTQGNIWGWISVYTVGLLILSLVFLVLFVAIERRVLDPMLHPKIFRTRNVFFTLVTAIVVGLCTYAMISSIPYLLRTPSPVGFGFSTLETGINMLPGALTIFVAGLYAGTLVNKWGGQKPLLIGAIALVVGYGALYAFHSSSLTVALDQMIIGAGIGFAYSAMAAIIVHSLPQEEVGVGSGVYTVMRSLGQVLGPTVTAAYLATYRAPLPIPTPSGVKMVSYPSVAAFNYIWLTIIGIALVGVVTSLLVRADVAKLEHRAPTRTPVDTTPVKSLAVTASGGAGIDPDPVIGDKSECDD